MSLQFQPLSASVTITASSILYYNSTSTSLISTNFRLLKGVVALAAANKASTAELEIEDNSNKWFSTFTVGASVAISLGKLSSTFVSVFLGLVERTRVERDTSGISLLRVHTTDLMQKLMNTIVISYERHQVRNTDGTLSASDASNMLVTDIIVNLMNSTDSLVYLNGVNSGITTALDTNSGKVVRNTGVSIPDVVFNYKPLHDCLKLLFDYLRYDWGVDETGTLYGRPIDLASDSGVTLDTSTIMQLSVEDDITDTKNVVFVVGGNQLTATGGVLTPTSGVMNNSSIFLAQKFTALSDNLNFVAVYIDKVAAPTNLACAVYTDDANKPSQQAIIYANIDKGGISSTAAAWAGFNANDKLTTGQPYWITLFSQKDNTNYYRWHTNGGAATSTATATDPLASAAAGGWSTVAATSAFIHNIYYHSPVITIAIDQQSTSTWGTRQLADRQHEIKNQQAALFWGQGLLSSLGKKKQILKIQTYPPNQVLKPGTIVTVGDSSIVTTTFIMSDVIYNLKGYETWSMHITAMRYVPAGAT